MMTESNVRRDFNINDLPDELLCHIISLIPIREAVCTSVLSKRWKHLFNSISNLDIWILDSVGEKLDQFMNFLDMLLQFRNEPSILRFSLQSIQSIDPHRLDKWICALVQRKIQQLDLRADFTIDGFLFATSLFSCESLVDLRLAPWFGCDLIVPSRIFLPRLKILHLHRFSLPNDGSEERLFSSCPVLEELKIIACYFGKGCVRFSISNQNLKTLTLQVIFSDEEKVVRILIKTPSLVRFNYILCLRHSPVFLDVKSLVEVIVDSDLNWCEDHANAASDLLRGIQNIQTLQLSSRVLQNLQRHNVRISFLGKLTCLEILDWNFECVSNGLVYLLTHCAALETLKLKEMARCLTNQETTRKYLLREFPVCLLSRLKTIEFWLLNKGAETLMPMFKFFLKNGKVLEELKICGNYTHPQYRRKVVRKILSLKRVSNTCRVTFSSR